MEKKLIGSHTVIYIGGGNSGWITEGYATCYRTFHKEIILAKAAEESRWTEWTDAQKTAWEKKHDEPFRDNDLVEQARTAGAVPNFATGYYELNTLTDITEQQMRRIIQWGRVNTAYCKGRYLGANIRTNLPFLTAISGGGGADSGFNCELMFTNSALEVVRVNDRFRPVIGLSKFAGVFRADSIRKIIGVVDLFAAPAGFAEHEVITPFGAALEEVQVRNLRTNLWLGNCPKLRPEAVRYAIARRNDQNGDKTQLRITLHPDVYALVTDPDNAEGVEIMALADEKNVTIATTE